MLVKVVWALTAFALLAGWPPNGAPRFAARLPAVLTTAPAERLRACAAAVDAVDEALTSPRSWPGTCASGTGYLINSHTDADGRQVWGVAGRVDVEGAYERQLVELTGPASHPTCG